MAQVAALSDKGPVRTKNQDACCVEVAQTPFGEVVMAVICDGVGGLELGELASATVVARFVKWFEEELPGLCGDGLVERSTVRFIWNAMLAELNELVQAHVVTKGGGVGTTFSGIFAHSGTFVAAHVGDTRIYQVGPFTFGKVTEDQTLLARELAAGRLTAEEAKTFPKRHVILQSVGTERSLKPAFYEGTYTARDVFVLCSDGAYRRPGSEGIRLLFQTAERSDAALAERCKTLVEQDIVHGEKDNVTVACFCSDPRSATSVGMPGGDDVDNARDGRGRASDVRVSDDEHLSRRHARITCREDGATIVDLGSANGTWVGGKMILKDKPAILGYGEPFFLSKCEYVIERESI